MSCPGHAREETGRSGGRDGQEVTIGPFAVCWDSDIV